MLLDRCLGITRPHALVLAQRDALVAVVGIDSALEEVKEKRERRLGKKKGIEEGGRRGGEERREKREERRERRERKRVIVGKG